MLRDTAKGQPLAFEDRIDPAHTALVVIDVQNDFSHPQGVTGLRNPRIDQYPPMLERLQALIAQARANGVFILHVNSHYDDVHLSRAAGEKWVSRGWTDSLCRRGGFGAEFAPGFEPQLGDSEALVTKHRFSSFWGSPIDLLLRANGIRTVLLTGISTEICVESHARDAFFRDYHVVEVDDCTGCSSAERDAASKTVIERAFGMVTQSVDVVRAWQAKAALSAVRGWQPAQKAARDRVVGLAERIAPKQTALVLVDLQNDYCADGGQLVPAGGADMIHAARGRALELLSAARQAGCLVIHLRTETGPRFRHAGSPRLAADGRQTQSAAASASAGPLAEPCQSGSWGAEFVAGVDPRADELEITKHRFSGFVDTALEQMLRSNAIASVVIAGFATNGAVESTARDAAMRDFHVTVAGDCVATVDAQQPLHEASLASLALYAGWVESGAAIARAWQAQPAATTSPAALESAS